MRAMQRKQTGKSATTNNVAMVLYRSVYTNFHVRKPLSRSFLHRHWPTAGVEALKCWQALNADCANSEEAEADQNTSTGEITRPNLQSRRKSVTFTPETKVEDGFSASSLFKEWTAEAASPQNGSADIHAQVTHENSTSKQSSGKIPSWLEYLQQYSDDRQSWRFNKNKQTGLLKNLFDVHLIPPQYTPSIVEYVSGLQGGAAQQRLLETATSVLRAIADRDQDLDLDSMESEEARRTAYATALKRHMLQYERSKVTSEYDEQQLAEMKREMERGQRAEAVLGELLRKELYPERYQQANPSQHQQKRPGMSVLNGDKKRDASASTSSSRKSELPKRKKRKVRTAGSDDSSDSSSDSEVKPSKGPTSIREALRPISGSPAQATTAKPKHIIFDDDLLDKKFPKDRSYHEVAPKRKRGEKKARGFAYTHGTKDDESGSESD